MAHQNLTRDRRSPGRRGGPQKLPSYLEDVAGRSRAFRGEMAASKGTVKAVLSADTIVVMGVPVGGPPPERQITLAGIIRCAARIDG